MDVKKSISSATAGGMVALSDIPMRVVRGFVPTGATRFSATVRLCMLGAAAVGKTSLLMQFAEREFAQSYIATIGVDFKVVYCQRGSGAYVKLQVWDTAGQERYQAMSKSYYRNADGMLMVYSQDDRTSFTFLQSILAEFEREDGGMGLEQRVASAAASAQGTPAGSAPPTRRKKLYLVANKYDLGDDQRMVPIAEAQALAKKYGMRFVECSAKGMHNVDVPFLSTADDILNDVTIEPESATPTVNLEPTKEPGKCAC